MSFLGDLAAQDRREGLSVDIRDLEAASLPTALDQVNNLHFLSVPRDVAAYSPVALADRVSAPESLIRLHDLAATAHRLMPSGLHCLADTVRHKPGGLVGYA